jgi:hypothetical protein
MPAALERPNSISPATTCATRSPDHVGPTPRLLCGRACRLAGTGGCSISTAQHRHATG